jgi:hypothetical protein
MPSKTLCLGSFWCALACNFLSKWDFQSPKKGTWVRTPSNLFLAASTILWTNINLTYTIIAWIEGFAIFLGVFIVAGVGSWNDWQKEKQFLRLQAESEKDNTVSNAINASKDLLLSV